MASNAITAKEQNSLLEVPELKDLKILFGIYTFLFITDYIMPQYFGVHIGYDITCTRFANILLVLYMVLNPKILTHFCKTVLECVLTAPLIAYMFVAGYTMVFRVDLNSFFLVFFEILTLYMLIYGIRYVLGYKRAMKWSIGCAYFLSVYGVVEFVYGRSIFLQFLSTVPNRVTNAYRSGHYRIMGPCGHALAYGLLLILFIGLSCIDYEKDEIYIFKRPLLIGLLYVNVFLTGSRSTLGIATLELFVLLLFSERRNIKKSLLILVAILIAMAVFLLLFYKTSIGQYILMQIASVIDQVFDTNYAGYFGADTTTLENSEGYRKYLPRIFTLDWLNPLVGRGVSRRFSVAFDGVYIHSIDNYYVQQYIKYAYPGLFSYVLFIIVTVVVMIKESIRYKSGMCKAVCIATLCYFYNLWWLDALQTLKYEYIVIAIFYAFLMAMKDYEKKGVREEESSTIAA